MWQQQELMTSVTTTRPLHRARADDRSPEPGHTHRQGELVNWIASADTKRSAPDFVYSCSEGMV